MPLGLLFSVSVFDGFVTHPTYAVSIRSVYAIASSSNLTGDFGEHTCLLGRPKISQSLVVVFAVDVEENSYIVYLRFEDSVQVIPKDGPAAHISLKRHDLMKNGTVQENRIASKALKHRNHDLCIGTPILIHNLIERLRPNERLVGQDNERGIYVFIKRG